MKREHVVLEGLRGAFAHGQRSVQDRPGSPDDSQIFHVQHFLVDHHSQGAAGIACRDIAKARGPGDARVILVVQYRNDRLLVPAGKPGAAEILPRFGIDPHRPEFRARNQIARGTVRIRPGQRVAFHIIQALDAAIGPRVQHSDIGRCAINLLGDRQRHHVATAFDPGSGIGGRAHVANLQLLRGEGLDDPSIVRRDQQLHRHLESGFQQFLIIIDPRQPVGIILTAQQAHADDRNLLGPAAFAGRWHLGRRGSACQQEPG